jgi:hypothetical protein
MEFSTHTRELAAGYGTRVDELDSEKLASDIKVSHCFFVLPISMLTPFRAGTAHQWHVARRDGSQMIRRA